eukprot:1178005-Prorocentrum_minimum.AAC.1
MPVTEVMPPAVTVGYRGQWLTVDPLHLKFWEKVTTPPQSHSHTVTQSHSHTVTQSHRREGDPGRG